LLLWGLGLLIAADAVLAAASGLGLVFLGIALWGAHMAMTQGLLSKLVADTAPDHLRASAFGLFNLATGLFMLAASLLAGLLWQWFGPGATFAAGGLFGAAAFAMLLLARPERRTGSIG
jgi:predicted MFS family arabinose efflux permease